MRAAMQVPRCHAMRYHVVTSPKTPPASSVSNRALYKSFVARRVGPDFGDISSNLSGSANILDATYISSSIYCPLGGASYIIHT